jgi:S1-C subfamily serine protease
VVARQLEDDKQAAHGAIGVAFDADVRGGRGGARIAGVVAEGPAALAEPPLQKGDVVVRVGEADVNGWRDVVAETRRRRPRERVEIGFERNGRTQETVVELGTAPPGVDSPYGYLG